MSRRRVWLSALAVAAAVLVVIGGVVVARVVREDQRSVESGSGGANSSADATARTLELSLDRARGRAQGDWDSRAVVEQAIADTGLSSVRVVDYQAAEAGGRASATVRIDSVGVTGGLGGGQNRTFSYCYRWALSPYSDPVHPAERLGSCA